MKVKAKCWIKIGDDWHKPGSVFDAEDFDENIMTACDEQEPESADPVEVEEPTRRGRKRKSEE